MQFSFPISGKSFYSIEIADTIQGLYIFINGME